MTKWLLLSRGGRRVGGRDCFTPINRGSQTQEGVSGQQSAISGRRRRGQAPPLHLSSSTDPEGDCFVAPTRRCSSQRQKGPSSPPWRSPFLLSSQSWRNTLPYIIARPDGVGPWRSRGGRDCFATLAKTRGNCHREARSYRAVAIPRRLRLLRFARKDRKGGRVKSDE